MSVIDKRVLDACCGGRMMWYDKTDQRILAHDIRAEVVTFTDGGRVRALHVSPDVLGDFRCMKFGDCEFWQVLFDPPHLLHAGEGSWLFKKYGRLDVERWQEDLRAGFKECMRVLAVGGTLIFKWNTYQLSKDKVEACFPAKPTFVSHQGKTYFYHFLKETRQ